MFNLLVLLFVIKFYVHSNVFKLIKKKHEQDAITAVIITNKITMTTMFLNLFWL